MSIIHDRNGQRHGTLDKDCEVEREYNDDGYWHSYTTTVSYPYAWYWHGKEVSSSEYREQQEKQARFIQQIPQATYPQVQKLLTDPDFTTDLVGEQKVEQAFHKNPNLTYMNYLRLSRKKGISEQAKKILFDLSVHRLEQDKKEREETRVLDELKQIKKLQVFASFLTEENLRILGAKKIFETVTFPVEKVLPIAQEKLSGDNLKIANKVLQKRFCAQQE